MSVCGFRGCKEKAGSGLRCPEHRARARERAGLEAVVQKDGSRTASVLMRCDERLKLEIQKEAKRMGLSAGHTLEIIVRDFLRKELP